MSEIFPAALPSPENKEERFQQTTLVDANAALLNAIHQVSSERRKQLMIRCDELPSTQGTLEDLETVFFCLLQLILQQTEKCAKAFLHIHCTTKEGNSSLPGLLEMYSIQFKTNITPCTGWLQSNTEQVNQAAVLLHKNGGCLVINQQPNTGCIFIVSLPGKTL